MDHKALLYAEKYGIIEYHMEGDKMVYYASFPMEHTTYKAVVNLETNEEHRTPMKNYYRAYDRKIGGRYQANYMA